MNKTQLDNLIKFSVLFRTEGLDRSSPDYVLEKWNSFIGNPKFKNLDDLIEEIRVNQEILYEPDKWRKKWNIIEKNTSKWLEVRNIAYFIYLVNKVKTLDITYILECYNRLFEYYDGEVINSNLHPLLEDKINTWLDSTRIKRDYKINLIKEKSTN